MATPPFPRGKEDMSLGLRGSIDRLTLRIDSALKNTRVFLPSIISYNVTIFNSKQKKVRHLKMVMLSMRDFTVVVKIYSKSRLTNVGRVFVVLC